MRYFLVCLLILSIFSCEQNKELNENELNLELEKNKQNFVFMSFYPNMPDRVKKALIKRELEKRTLKEVPSKIKNWDEKDLIYTLKYDKDEIADFKLYFYKNHVLLGSYESELVDFTKEDHAWKLSKILNIYEKKYKIIDSKNDDKSFTAYIDHLEEYKYYGDVNDSIVLKNNSNVVILKSSFGRMYNYKNKRYESQSNVSLSHYTKKTFNDFLDKLHKDNLYNESLRMKKSEKIKKDNNETLQHLR